jgi:DNA-directed RNA polymerase subunit M/transcription elongation factor TFIIS
MDKQCQECGDILIGRMDKKFCSDLCRNAFNNKVNSNTNVYVRNVNSILKKNRKILEEFVPEQTAKASKSKLQQRGFNFAYYTNIYTTKKGQTYFFCYEYGYLPLENEYYFLVKQIDKRKNNPIVKQEAVEMENADN